MAHILRKQTQPRPTEKLDKSRIIGLLEQSVHLDSAVVVDRLPSNDGLSDSRRFAHIVRRTEAGFEDVEAVHRSARFAEGSSLGMEPIESEAARGDMKTTERPPLERPRQPRAPSNVSFALPNVARRSWAGTMMTVASVAAVTWVIVSSVI